MTLPAAIAAVELLAARPGRGLGARFKRLFIGLAAAEILGLPALFVALGGVEAFGLPQAGAEPWLAAALYVGLTVYVFARLFPWREVGALAAAPEVNLRDLLARLKDKDGQGGVG
ncbi:MAG: hypothetical protein EXQ89_03525 [Rhodospirillaceae bacterium]|nr:hypothetical protein [Rhodospirillaceae bacterium]